MIYYKDASVTIHENTAHTEKTTKVAIPSPFDILTVNAVLRNRENGEEVLYVMYEGGSIND